MSDKRSALRLVSLISGKGGVGKSILAFNLAERLAASGYRILLIDGDLAFPNLHILANAAPLGGIAEYADGRLGLTEATTTLNDNLSLLAGVATTDIFNDQTPSLNSELLAQVQREAETFDLAICDLPSGTSGEAAGLVARSDLAMIVLIPELTSISDAFGLYKMLNAKGLSSKAQLLVNGAKDRLEVDYIQDKFRLIADKFIGSSPDLIGWIPADQAIRRSLGAQRPVAVHEPDSDAAQAIEALARRLAERLGRGAEDDRTNQSPKTKDSLAKADIGD